MTSKLALAILALLAACSTTYTREGATPEEFRREDAQCNAQAMSAAPPTGLAALAQKEAIRGACLEGKGWTPK